MKENFNLDMISLHLQDIIDSAKLCIVNSSKPLYMADEECDLKDTLYALMNIMDCARYIENDIYDFFSKREQE